MESCANRTEQTVAGTLMSLKKAAEAAYRPAEEPLDPEEVDLDWDVAERREKRLARKALRGKADEGEESKPPKRERPEGPRIHRADPDLLEDPKYGGAKVSRQDLYMDVSETESGLEESFDAESSVESSVEPSVEDSASVSSDLQQQLSEETSDEDGADHVGNDTIRIRKKMPRKQDSAHVKNQFSLWCELMGFRIRMQALLQDVKKFPGPEAMRTDPEIVEGLQKVLVSLCKLRFHAFENAHHMMGEADLAVSHDINWEFIKECNDTDRTFYEKTFDTWHDRTTSRQGKSKKLHLQALNKSLSAQVDQVMSVGEETVARSQMRHPGEKRINEEELKEAMHDPEIYDDSTFYQQLLVSFVTANSANSAIRDITEGVDNEEVKSKLETLKARQNRRKRKREVDTKASKGRKLRYNVHDKLVNFATPRPNALSSVDTGQLFSSLFQ